MPNFEDLTGQIFNRWTVLGLSKEKNRTSRKWDCRCRCGTTRSILTHDLIVGTSKSCGCYRSSKVDSLVGMIFGRWTVISLQEEKNKNGSRIWFCRCECGNEKTVPTAALKNGDSQSCGCFKGQRMTEVHSTHGHTSHYLYHTWRGMIDRCYRPDADSYPRYGGRGITVCEEWISSVEKFVADMGPRPKGMTLDRIDNNGNYESANCKWATRQEQQRNTKRNKYLTVNGVTKTYIEWAETIGVNDWIIHNRVRAGWSPEKIVSTPVDETKSFSKDKRSGELLTINGQTKTIAEWSESSGLSRQTIRWRSNKGWDEDEIINTPPQIQSKRTK